MLRSSLVAGDGSFTLTRVVSAPGGGTSPETIVESGGVYCGHAGCRPQLLIVYESGANADALVDGSTLTLTRPDLVLVYSRTVAARRDSALTCAGLRTAEPPAAVARARLDEPGSVQAYGGASRTRTPKRVRQPSRSRHHSDGASAAARNSGSRRRLRPPTSSCRRERDLQRPERLGRAIGRPVHYHDHLEPTLELLLGHAATLRTTTSRR